MSRTALLLPALLVVIAAACGPSPFAKPAEPAATSGPATSGPLTPAEWKDLCEAQGERARRCPGPAPEPLAICTDTAACYGKYIRPEIVRELAKCQQSNDCRRSCTIDRATATAPRSPTMRDLEEACSLRRTVCPTLDCNALTRSVRAFDEELTAPLVECMRYEKSCIDVANCYLSKLTPIVEKLKECGDPLLDDGDRDAGPRDAGPSDAGLRDR